jgi:hypothetical protein
MAAGEWQNRMARHKTPPARTAPPHPPELMCRSTPPRRGQTRAGQRFLLLFTHPAGRRVRDDPVTEVHPAVVRVSSCVSSSIFGPDDILTVFEGRTFRQSAVRLSERPATQART